VVAVFRRTGQTNYSAARLMGLAFALSIVMAIELAAGNGFLKALLTGELPWQSLAMVGAMVVIATGAIVGAFNATLKPSPSRIAATVGSCALALVAGLEASHRIARLPALFYFSTTLLGHAVYVYCVAFIIVAALRIAGRWSQQTPLVATSALVAFGAAGFVGQSWISLDDVAARLPLVRDLVLVLTPLGLLAACSLHRPLMLDPKSRMTSLLARLPLGKDERPERHALIVLGAGLALSLALSIALHATGLATGPLAALAPLAVVSLGWLGVMAQGVSELRLFTGEQRHGQVTAKLASTSAQRFLRRHLMEKHTWAATVGLKTTNFHIDHDPGSYLAGHLPASIMQIRAEEIQRCVAEVLGVLHLHSHAVGHRIFGAIDPEAATRPCVDALKMFACLYLDAGPLVERRIKGLASLLPIIDPGLARMMRAKDIGSLIRRNQWFFHFDFGWIDQHVIHTPRSTRYDVRMGALSSRIRNAMLDYLAKTNGVGNFVWLGPEARDRLLQEAPALRQVIEACPIPASGGHDELLMFIIKFEQLIPRLQRYFDLDSMRAAIADFEPSPESARLLGLLGRQLAKANKDSEVLDALGAIASVPWRGFREKDSALQLVVQAFDELSRRHTPGAELGDSSEQAHRALRDQLVEAVRAVGYPSQVLHNAHIKKLALRDQVNLREVATDPTHPRFQEAWLLMATADYQKYSPMQRAEMLALLQVVAVKPTLSDDALVQAKAVDTLASLGRVATDVEHAPLRQALDRMGAWFAESAAGPDVCALLLDAQAFLEAHLHIELTFSSTTTGRLEKHVDSLQVRLGREHPQVIALLSRWQEARVRSRSGSAAA
jgi:hypothetical protein